MTSLAPLTAYLNDQVLTFENPAFIANDPIAIPHGFEDPLDREIIGLYAALLAWGQRKTVLNKLEDLCERMDYKPGSFVYDFDLGRDGHRLEGFKHRTFQPVDAHWFTYCLSRLLRTYGTIEKAFACHLLPGEAHTGKAIQGFSESLLSAYSNVPPRLRKHLARPNTGSACKRINMYLRWMVRPGPVDFGIWNSIRPGQLILPLDIHSGRQARILGMLSSPQNNWKAALELTQNCKMLDPNDPCRYDFVLFGLGVSSTPIPPEFCDEHQIDVTGLRRMRSSKR